MCFGMFVSTLMYAHFFKARQKIIKIIIWQMYLK